MKIGAYMPKTGGLKRAMMAMETYGGNCIMIYTGSPKSFYRPMVDPVEVHQAMTYKAISGFKDIVIHAPYIINPANPSVAMQDKAIACLSEELKRTAEYGSKLLVIHPGSAIREDNDGVANLARVLNSLTETESDVTICVETMAGKGTEIMSKFNQFSRLFSLLNKPDRVGVCFDTCHVHDAGYDLSEVMLGETLSGFDELVGLNKIKVIHVNGSLNTIGAHKDRHANIGSPTDKIGADALRNLCNLPIFEDVPKILETPWEGSTNQYKKEIALLIQDLDKGAD